MNEEDALIASIAESIERELREDYVELWVLAGRIRRELPRVSVPEMQRLAEALLTILVAKGVVVGSDVGGEFEPWDAEDPVGEVMKEWRELGRDPNIGEIAWLDLPA